MARRIPALDRKFASAVDEALQLSEAGERIRALAPPRSLVRRELRTRRLEALYETSFLRIFLLWEDLLEQSFLRYICGYESSAGAAALRAAKFSRLSDAETAILGTRDFVSWANPDSVISRSRQYMNGGVHETVLNSDLSRLKAFSAIRNRIAHSSDFARQQFDNATLLLAGRRFPASSAGRLLRQTAVSLPSPETWLHHIAAELKSLALQLCP
jgi:hypothetical protein